MGRLEVKGLVVREFRVIRDLSTLCDLRGGIALLIPARLPDLPPTPRKKRLSSGLWKSISEIRP